MFTSALMGAPLLGAPGIPLSVSLQARLAAGRHDGAFFARIDRQLAALNRGRSQARNRTASGASTRLRTGSLGEAKEIAARLRSRNAQIDRRAELSLRNGTTAEARRVLKALQNPPGERLGADGSLDTARRIAARIEQKNARIARESRRHDVSAAVHALSRIGLPVQVG